MDNDFDVAGVTLASARRWWRGEVSARLAADLDTSRGEVAFLNELGNRASYRNFCAAVLKLWAAGARGGIAHVVSPIILKKYLRYGALVTFTETICWRGQELPAVRMLIPADAFRRWCERMGRTAAGKSAARQIES